MKKHTDSFGKYTLLEKLASGGMAEVFLACAAGAGGTRKFVAIKRILPQFSDSPEYKDMFTSEAKIAINLSHSNVVSIYEFGIEKSQLYLVMDYVEGRNLRQILNKLKEKSKTFSIAQIVYVIKQVAAGLDHAHRCLGGTTGEPLNIIHRDMSPQNMMVNFEGEVKIVDFGIAKAGAQTETTPDGTLKGKFGYMSPEQAEGQSVDLKTDIFSLGIVLWELLANERLFLANNEINTLRKIRKCQIPSLRKINPNIHPELERITRKALAKDQNFRYQHSAAFHRDLNRFLNKGYPNFVPHDFSVFIQKIYADEILEARKRLVEYAKIPLEQKEDKAPPTNQENKSVDSSLLVLTNSLASAVTLTDSKDPVQLNTQTDPDNIAFNEESSELSQDTVNSLRKISMEFSQSGVHSSKSTRTRTSTNIHNKFNVNTKTDFKGMKKGAFNHPAAILLILSALFVLIYIVYMGDTGQMGGGGEKSPAQRASLGHEDHNPSQQATKNKTNRPSLPVTRPQVTKPLPISISSDPSGAGIFINGRNTGKSTPGRVLVPSNQSINIELKKESYITYEKRGVIITQVGKVFQAKLQRAAIGYLDIDVRPPSPAVKIYLDGKLLKGERLPIRRYAVPAKKLIIEAKNPVNNTYAKQRIILQQDQRRSIVFRLKHQQKKSRRNPSHQK